MTAPSHPGELGLAGDRSLAPARPSRIWLGILLLLPGGLLVALGAGIAWVGLVLCWPGLRRMTAAVGGPVVAPEQPHGTEHEPSPPIVWIGTRTPWASYGDSATTTGCPWGEES